MEGTDHASLTAIYIRELATFGRALASVDVETSRKAIPHGQESPVRCSTVAILTVRIARWHWRP